ncbi:MAG: tRNA/rRNA methyltransferase [Bacteroidales bacterium]
MHFTFILVEPKVPENIGASARALKTMGFDSLRLIKPSEYMSGKAKWVAHGSFELLENARVFENLSDAISDMDLVIGTTARYRLVKQDYTPVSELRKILDKKSESVKNVAIIFGREESGLSNEEILQCDITTSIPLKSDFPSLNLSQAVMIYAYELSSLQQNEITFKSASPDGESVRALKEKVKPLLKLSGIAEDSALFGRIMERNSLAGDIDIKIMHSVATGVMKNYNQW